MCEITLNFSTSFTVKENMTYDETCKNLRSNSLVYAKYLTGPAWKLWLKPSHCERRAVSSTGTYSGWDDKFVYLHSLLHPRPTAPGEIATQLANRYWLRLEVLYCNCLPHPRCQLAWSRKSNPRRRGAGSRCRCGTPRLALAPWGTRGTRPPATAPCPLPCS